MLRIYPHRGQIKLTVNLREDPVSCREDHPSSCPLLTTLTTGLGHYGQAYQGLQAPVHVQHAQLKLELT